MASLSRPSARRAAVQLGIAALAVAAALVGPRSASGFAFDDVARRAQEIAEEPYRDRQTQVPKWMLVGAMSYDQWRDIRFRPDRALWRDEHLPFQVQFFHPGLYFDRSVQVNVVEDGTARPLPFSARFFDYGKNDFAADIPPDIGWAGLRVHAQLKRADYFDELVVFLGASYFRAVGRDNVYGLSARGLAVDTAEPSGEEFPRFTEFWLEKPAPDATSMVVDALLDGPTASGAYRFTITPGVQTVTDVEVRLFPRRVPAILGLAPLTSMFFFGENTVRHFDDFRPEVHDSDGLAIHFDTGEWLWRPLDNPTRIDVASFHTKNPRGFGLVQRDRSFADYQDIETRAELRPSTWVEPRGDWGEGQIRLLELPTGNELADNMVAFWVPDNPPKPGASLAYAYRLWWYGDDPARPPGARAVATRRDRGAANSSHDAYRYVIDFEGDTLNALPPDATPKAVVSATNGGTLFDQHVYKNPVTGGWRLTFQLRPKPEKPVELRAYLVRNRDVLTETWSYVWLP